MSDIENRKKDDDTIFGAIENSISKQIVPKGEEKYYKDIPDNTVETVISTVATLTGAGGGIAQAPETIKLFEQGQIIGYQKFFGDKFYYLQAPFVAISFFTAIISVCANILKDITLSLLYTVGYAAVDIALVKYHDNQPKEEKKEPEGFLQRIKQTFTREGMMSMLSNISGHHKLLEEKQEQIEKLKDQESLGINMNDVKLNDTKLSHAQNKRGKQPEHGIIQ